MKRRCIAVVLALCMVFSVAPVFAYGGSSSGGAGKAAAAVSFSDLKPTHWAYSFIDQLIGRGIIAGYKDGTFKPESYVTRAEFAKLVVLAINIPVSDATSSSFSDVAADHWALRYIEAAKNGGIINGYAGGTFRPENKVTRAEIAKMVLAAINLKSAQSIKSKADAASFSDISGHWAYDAIVGMRNQNIINGYPDGTFKPDRNATRAEAAKMVVRLLAGVLGIQIPNPDAPVITITSPTDKDQYATSNNSISISGTASDDERVSSVTWVNRLGGAGSAEGTATWSIPNIALQDGANLIIVTAKDNKGNTATDSLLVTYTPASNGGGNGGSNNTSAKPVLQMAKVDERWASPDDYNSGVLTVQYSLTNLGSGNALSTEVKNIFAYNNVEVLTLQPISLGTIAAGSLVYFDVKYKLPNTIMVYSTSLDAACKDAGGNSYNF